MIAACRWRDPATVAVLVVCATLAGPATAAAAQRAADGMVTGELIESDGTPVAGATVVLEGPLPASRQRRTITERRGRFRFTAVAPGRYRLQVELPGLAAPGDLEVTVARGQQLSTTLVLSLFAYGVSIRVGAQAPQDEPVFTRESTADAQRLTQRELALLPLPAEDALDALPVLPGVVAGGRGLISVGGTLPADSAFLLNGADLQDTYSGRYRFRVPLDAIDSVELQSGVRSALGGERLGGVIDVTTAAGTDTWETTFGSVIPRPWFRDGRLAGIRRFSPRLRIAGPLVPGRIFLSHSLEYRFERERVRDVPDDSGDHVRVEGWEWLTQLDMRLGSDHQLRIAGFLFPQSDRFAGLDALTPLESTRLERNRSAAGLLSHQWRLDDRSFVETTAQLNRISIRSRPLDPIAGAPFRVRPDSVRGSAFRSLERVSHHGQVRSVYTRALGRSATEHVFQAGFELHRISVNGSGSWRPVRIENAAGELLRRVEFRGGERLHGAKSEWALFVQHRFRPVDRFWLDVGLRLSRDSAARRPDLGPRLGVAWDVTGGGRTLLKAGVGLLHRRIYVAEMLWEQNPTRLESGPDGATVELAPRLDDEIRTPRALLLTAEITQRLATRLTARVRASLRESRRRLVFDRDGDSLLLSSDGTSTARALELTFNVRLGRDQQLFLSYVRSSARGDLNDFSRLADTSPDPVILANAFGPLPFDTPHRLVLWGVLHLPADLRVAPLIEWRDGFPYSRLTATREYAGTPADARFPTYLSADFNLTRGLRLFGRAFRAGVQVRNVTGHFNPRDVVAAAGSARSGLFLNDTGRRFRIRFSARF